jgi:general secretion pathway protein E
MEVSVIQEDIPQLLNKLIERALNARASDIHIEPYPEAVRVRFRIDGLLFPEGSLDHISGIQTIARIKVLSRLNVAEYRLPQDGKFSCFGQTLDIRVSTFPTLYGETVVLRLLDRSKTNLQLADLGLSPELRNTLTKLSDTPQGFFLVTGPTGCGKTTTLHALLSHVHTPQKHTVTLEDPIEYTVDGITQTQVAPEIGLTFARGLRSLLRQDPDIIMVGEIRDTETAQVALQAALTGHLVLSTLHTLDAPGALIRLLDMGIPPYLIVATTTGVLAQRLARRLCLSCRYEREVTAEEQQQGIVRAYASTGCAACRGAGTHGQIGIFEFLRLSSELKQLFLERPSYDELSAQASNEGMVSLFQDALCKVNAGIIGIGELTRVVGSLTGL